MEGILDNLRGFSGKGFLFVLLLASIVFLGLKLKKGVVKTLTVWFPIFVLAIFFCPLWSVYMKHAEDGEILYRIMWMIPYAVIVGFALVEAIEMLPRKARPISLLLAIAVIMVSGRYIYINPHFSKAENSYHVPQVIVDICDDIIVEGREVRACFPIEHIQYVRQYTPYVCLAYGRTVLLGYGFNEYSNVDEFLDKEVVDIKGLTEALRGCDTPYLILKNDRKITEKPDKYGFKFVRSYDDYDLYLDENAYLGLGEKSED